MLLAPYGLATADAAAGDVDERHVPAAGPTRRVELDTKKTPGWCRLPK